MLRPAIAILIVALAHVAHAQQVYVSDWYTISSTREVRDADSDSDGSIWAATSGGVQRTWITTGSSAKYDNVNGLSTLDCSSIYCDKPTGTTYVGQRDGSLDLFNASADSWERISDIQRASQYPKRAIIDFAQRGDTIAMATEFGVVLMNGRTRLFIETVDRIGVYPEKSKVQALAFVDGTIWVVVNGSLSSAPLNIPTLRLPSAWRLMSQQDGLPDSSEPILHLAAAGSTCMVASARNVYRWSSGRFTRVQTTEQDINGLSIDNDGSYIVSTSSVIFKNGAVIDLESPLPSGVLGSRLVTAPSGSSMIVAFIADQGLGWIKDGRYVSSYDTTTPRSNQFTDISIDTKGWIWAATHTDGGYGGQGVQYFDGLVWKSLTTSNEPVLRTNGCYRVSSLADGSTWIGTWGRGAIKATHSDAGLRITGLNAGNSSLRGIPADSNYILVSEAAMDKYGRTFLLNEQSTDRLLAVADNAGAWSYLQNCANTRENLYRSLAVDGNGTVWCGSPDSRGLIGYNDKRTQTTDDDVCNKIVSSNSQLQDNVVTSLAVDQNGALWIGTAKGLSVISSPWNLSNTAIPYVRRVSAMSTTYINDVFVDALNYKWIATTNGVFVLDESGIEVLATITTATAPLLDNNVRSIVIDPATGLAYFGTLKGCSVARTSSMRPLQTFDVRCYPQPFRIGTDPQIVIDGLGPDSEVRIMTSGGILVSAIAARGRQALWNGLDVGGNPVPPGIYIASVSSGSTGTSAVVKFAVTR
ncbi:MAG: hypothetical protein RLZZ273_1617 [Bacteroidota bacterium]|jgi:ligand-binding sensor domain-containing protein